MTVHKALEKLGNSFQSRPATLAENGSSSLPAWPEKARGAPNILLRSALFSASRTGRAYLQCAEIYSQGSTSMSYTGARLNQSDHDIWLTLLHLCRHDPNSPVYTTAYELLQYQKKTDTGANRRTLYSGLARLNATGLEVRHLERTYMGSLVEEVFRDDETHRLVIALNPRLIALFSHSGISYLNWEVRRLLASKPLAQWLHGYFSTHKKPYPIRAKTLLEMAGSNDRSDASGEQNLVRALEALKEASTAGRQKFEYKIDDGKVIVRRL